MLQMERERDESFGTAPTLLLLRYSDTNPNKRLPQISGKNLALYMRRHSVVKIQYITVQNHTVISIIKQYICICLFNQSFQIHHQTR